MDEVADRFLTVAGYIGNFGCNVPGGGGVHSDTDPYPPGGTNGSGGDTNYYNYTPPTYTITTNYIDYTNFWLEISNSTSQAFVNIASALPGLTYEILTNTQLNGTNWGVWQTLLASNSVSTALPMSLGSNALFFEGVLLGYTSNNVYYAGASNGAPSIVSQPTSLIVSQGGAAVFNVAAVGAPPLRCQWSFDGTNIPGATLSYLSNANAQAANVGWYTATISNAQGSVTSAIATLALSNSSPLIIFQPGNQTDAIGTTATFDVVAIGALPLTFQWSYEGVNIVGATNSALTPSNLDCNAGGEYSVAVSNGFGGVTSSNVALEINIPVSAPASATGIENYPLSVTGVTVNSNSTETNEVQARFSVTNGVINFSSTIGLTFIQGTNGATSNLVVKGSLIDVNAALGQLAYIPHSNFFGSDVLNIATSCSGGGITNTAAVLLQILEGPSGMSNLVLWLSADSGVSASGTNVNNWTDKSGNSNNAHNSSHQPTLQTNMLNGYPVVHFASSAPNSPEDLIFNSNFLSGAPSAEAFVMLRATTNSSNPNRVLWSFGNGFGTFYSPSGISDDFDTTNVNGWPVGSPAIPLTQFHLYDSMSETNNWSCWINGLLQFTAANNAPLSAPYAEIGAGYRNNGYEYGFDGDIAEIIIFHRALTVDERQAIGMRPLQNSFEYLI